MIKYKRVMIIFFFLPLFLFGCGYEIDEDYKQYSLLEGEELYKGITYKIASRMEFEGYETFMGYEEIEKGNIEITLLNAPLFGNEVSNKRESLLRDSSKWFKESFSLDTELDNLIINWNVTYRDDFGNLQVKEVLNVGLSRSTYDKINWDHFKNINFEKVSDIYYEDSEFKADELEKERISKMSDLEKLEQMKKEELENKDKKEVECEKGSKGNENKKGLLEVKDKKSECK